MATIQQSIEVGVPVHAAYHQLTQFEDYPRFMEYVEAVQQLDESHLHWSTSMPHQRMEWDSEITEQQPDRCIAWRNLSGPASSGRVELRPAGDDRAQVTLTMECDPLQFAPAQDGNADAELERRIGQDLVRFKKLVETPGLHPDTTAEPAAAADSSGAAVGKTVGQSAAEQREANQTAAPAATANANASVPAAGYAAGGEGWSGDEDPQQPVISASDQVAAPPASGSAPAAPADNSALSDNSLSQSSADRNTEGQFNVAEEQSFDQQSEQARHVGQLPGGDADDSDFDPGNVLAQALQPDPDQEAQDPHGRRPKGKRPDSPPG